MDGEARSCETTTETSKLVTPVTARVGRGGTLEEVVVVSVASGAAVAGSRDSEDGLLLDQGRDDAPLVRAVLQSDLMRNFGRRALCNS